MEQLYCNKCGKEIKVILNTPHEDFVLIRKNWGYFSKKDGRTQQFILCETCMEKLEREFQIPSMWSDTTELL